MVTWDLQLGSDVDDRASMASAELDRSIIP